MDRYNTVSVDGYNNRLVLLNYISFCLTKMKKEAKTASEKSNKLSQEDTQNSLVDNAYKRKEIIQGIERLTGSILIKTLKQFKPMTNAKVESKGGNQVCNQLFRIRCR